MMKKYLLITLVGLIAMSCSSEGDDSVPNPDGSVTENNVPTIPVLSEPTDNTLCIASDLAFGWGTSTDPDGDAVKYTMEISKNNDFTQITHLFNNLTATTRNVSLERGVAYYWRVKAVDSKNGSSTSEVFKFYTEGLGEENHLPFSPTLLLPNLNATVQGSSELLVWGATDVDNDVLTFDIYLGTNSSLTTPLVTDYAEKNYVASSLLAGTTYYWKVVAKDGRGGISIGQVWSFTTE